MGNNDGVEFEQASEMIHDLDLVVVEDHGFEVDELFDMHRDTVQLVVGHVQDWPKEKKKIQ